MREEQAAVQQEGMSGRLLVIGAGQIGLEVALRFGSKTGMPVHLHCLTPTETAAAVRIARERGIAVSGFSSGDLAFENTDLEINGRMLALGSLARTERSTADIEEESSPVPDSYVELLLEQVQPRVVIDATNMATVTQGTLGLLLRVLNLDSLPLLVRRAVRYRLISNALVRYTLRLGFACARGGVNRVVKVSTTGLGGMGLEIAFTHGDRPWSLLSEDIWTKVYLAGVQLQTLSTLARSVPFPVHVVVPATCVGFDENITWVELSGRDGTLPDDAATPSTAACANPMRLALIGCGENLTYSRTELAVLTHPAMMGAVSKQEVAEAVMSVLGGDSSADAVAALARTAVGPSFLGQAAARAACSRLEEAERAAGTHAVTTGHLGPHVAGLLFEAAVLEVAFGGRWPARILLENPTDVAHAAQRGLQDSAALQVQMQHLGCVVHSDAGVLEAGAASEIRVDLRAARIGWWQERTRDTLKLQGGAASTDDIGLSVLLAALRHREAPADIKPEPVLLSEARLRALLKEFSSSRLVIEAVAHGLFEHLSVQTNVELSVLASLLRVAPTSLHRICRALAARGLLILEGTAVRACAASECLRDAHPRSLAPMARLIREAGWPAWSRLGEALVSGRSPATSDGQSPFAAFANDEDAARRFSAQMIRVAERTAESVAAALQLSGPVRVLDIGGGDGVLAAALLRRDPDVHVTILDLHHVASGAQARLSRLFPAQRWSFLAGDFFRDIPGEFHVYVLSRVLHDWDDADARRLLAGCARAATPGSRLVIFEKMEYQVSPSGLYSVDFTMSDLNNWLMCGGRERTVDEAWMLVKEAGFSPLQMVSITDEHKLLFSERR